MRDSAVSGCQRKRVIYTHMHKHAHHTYTHITYTHIALNLTHTSFGPSHYFILPGLCISIRLIHLLWTYSSILFYNISGKVASRFLGPASPYISLLQNLHAPSSTSSSIPRIYLCIPVRYGRSLMQRLLDSGCLPTVGQRQSYGLLDTQYRMHPVGN